MNRLGGQARVFTGGEQLVRLQDVDQMMGDAPPSGERELRRPNIEMAVHLQRIAIDDFAIEMLCQVKSQIALPGTSWTDYRNQRTFGRVCIEQRVRVRMLAVGRGVGQVLASKPRYTIET